MQSKAATVQQYLAELPPERREAIARVREVILANLDPGFAEGMQYGMIGYCVPHSLYPKGYHCDPKQPLPFAGLASQKNHMSLYIGCLYWGADAGSPTSEAMWFRSEWMKTGKKLDMGKGCVRFKRLDDLPLDLIGESFRRVTAAGFIAVYERLLAASRPGRPGAKPAPKSKPRRAAAKASSPAREPAKKRASKPASKPASKSAKPSSRTSTRRR